MQFTPILRLYYLRLSLKEVSFAQISIKLKKTLRTLAERLLRQSMLGFVQSLIHPAPSLQLQIIVWQSRMCSAMHLELCADLNFSALKTDFLVI